jgi:lactoylglutathione lyase
MFVADRDRAKSFYEKAFDAEPVFEDGHSIAFKFENMIVNLLVASEAHDLIGPAVVAGQDAGSRFQLTIAVNDVDATCEDLAIRGVELLNGPIARGACAQPRSPTRTAISGRSQPKSPADRGRFYQGATTLWPAANAALANSTPMPRPAPVMNQVFLSVMWLSLSFTARTKQRVPARGTFPNTGPDE